MLLHNSLAISSTSWSSAMCCVVGKAVCSLLMTAVDTEMKLYNAALGKTHNFSFLHQHS